jgi:hypothetical protein
MVFIFRENFNFASVFTTVGFFVSPLGFLYHRWVFCITVGFFVSQSRFFHRPRFSRLVWLMWARKTGLFCIALSNRNCRVALTFVVHFENIFLPFAFALVFLFRTDQQRYLLLGKYLFK